MLVAIDKTKLCRAEGKVIKAAEYAELLEAGEVLSAAFARAQELKSAAERERESVRAAGFKKGWQNAQAEFAASVVEATEKMETAFQALEGRIAKTVMRAVRQVLGELRDEDVMASVIRRVLEQCRSEKRLRLRVAATQFEPANDSLNIILKDFPDVEFVEVVKDPQAATGTCILESEFGVVDGSVETQLAAVQAGLVNALAGKRQTGGD